MSALGANPTRRDGRNDVNEPKRTWLTIMAQWIGHGHAVSCPLDRNNFSTIDSGRLSLYKLDAGSQPECNAHRVHRSGSVRNAKQGLANSGNSERIGAPPVRSCTCALRHHELLRAAR